MHDDLDSPIRTFLGRGEFYVAFLVLFVCSSLSIGFVARLVA